MNVAISDRKEKVEHLRLALALSGMVVPYETADLIQRVLDGMELKKGKFSIKDGCQIQTKWELYWLDYSDLQKKKRELEK